MHPPCRASEDREGRDGAPPPSTARLCEMSVGKGGRRRSATRRGDENAGLQGGIRFHLRGKSEETFSTRETLTVDAPFFRSRVGGTAESDWCPSLGCCGCAAGSSSCISSADCVFRIPSVAASTSVVSALTSILSVRGTLPIGGQIPPRPRLDICSARGRRPPYAVRVRERRVEND